MKSLLLISFLVLLAVTGFAGDAQDFYRAKNEYLSQDRAYLQYLREKEKRSQIDQQALEAHKWKRAWLEWKQEELRQRYIEQRDAKQRIPATVIESDEQKYDRENAKVLKDRDKDRVEHIRQRELREKARQDVQAHPISESVKQRNEEPWEK